MKYILLLFSSLYLLSLQAQTGESLQSVLPKMCSLSGQKSSGSEYLYSDAFLYLAEVAKGIPSPGANGKYDTRKLDKNAIRHFLADNYVTMMCEDGKHFLAKAYEANNKDLLNDLLDLLNLYFGMDRYESWHYDFTSVELAYDGKEVTDFVTFLQSQTENTAKSKEWIRAIENQKVRTLQYMYETNSRHVLVYYLKNDPNLLNQAMDYGNGLKNTYLGYVESRNDSDQKQEWLALLRTDPSKIKE